MALYESAGWEHYVCPHLHELDQRLGQHPHRWTPEIRSELEAKIGTDHAGHGVELVLFKQGAIRTEPPVCPGCGQAMVLGDAGQTPHLNSTEPPPHDQGR